MALDYGITRASLYNWQSKYGGKPCQEIEELEEENRELKQIAVEIVEEYEVNIVRTYKLMELHRSYHIIIRRSEVIQKLKKRYSMLATQRRRVLENIKVKYGTIRKVPVCIHYEKCVRLKKRLPAMVMLPLKQPSEPNTT